MKIEKRLFIAFLLNISFSIFEFIGGALTGSVAISSDAIHDLGDAISIGISFFLEKYSKKRPNLRHTYGYARYSTLGALITTIVLIVGAIFILVESAKRIAAPSVINHDGMLVLAVIGVVVNSIAAYFTNEKTNANQRAVNLHMLEDVFSWFIILAGAVLIKATGLAIIDPILSIAVAILVLAAAIKNLKPIATVFLEIAPDKVSLSQIKKHIASIDGVISMHHIHLWSADEHNTYLTIHVVIAKKSDPALIKSLIRDELAEHGVSHAVIETEIGAEPCSDPKHKNDTTHVPTHHH